MASTFFGLNISASGLRAANAGLNTTANNISNSDTDGYSRQNVVQQATNPTRTFTTYGCSGGGVDTIAIERIRNSFYDVKYRANEAKVGEFEKKDYYTKIIENYFTDDGTTGFKTIFDDMTKSLQEVSKNPSSASTKAQYISSMKTLTDYFNNMSGDLHDLQIDVNDEMKTLVDQINSMAQEISSMNKQINVIEMTGTTANELRDQRDVLIDKLSKYVDVDTKETPVYDSFGDPTGASRFIVKIAGGQNLVDDSSFRTIETQARKTYEKQYQTDVDGLYEFYWSDGTKFSLDNAAMGGALKGLGDLRDGNNGERFYGTVKSSGTDKEGNQTAVIEVTDPKLCDMSKSSLPDNGGVITIKNQLYYYKDWSFSYDETTKKGTYTFSLDYEKNGVDMGVDKLGSEAFCGSTSKYQGIPYYMEQMNEWVRTFAAKVNEIFSAGVDADGNDAGILLSGTYATDAGQFTEEELNDSAGNGKGYCFLTAGNFSIVEDLLIDSNLLGVRTNASDGAEQCGQIRELIDTISNKDKYSFRGNDASGFLENIISDAALNASNAIVFSNSYQTLSNIIGNQRQSISGVDQDEEAVNLIKYQNTYTLCSKMISTFTEIYDRLILETGV